MIKSIFQNPFHGVMASSLLQRNRWCNVSEYICQISLFSQSHVSQKWSICLYYDTTLHLLWSKRSSLWSDNIACNWKDSFTFTACHWDCKDNPDQKSKKRSICWKFHQFSWSMSTSGITFSYVEHSFWNLLVGVVVTMIMIKIGENHVIWPAHKAETKIQKNPGEISEQSRD